MKDETYGYMLFSKELVDNQFPSAKHITAMIKNLYDFKDYKMWLRW